MEQLNYISVSDLNRYLYSKFDNDNNLRQVYLEGEISNFKRSGNHFYFSLKDENAEISAMFFYPSNLSLSFSPKDGMKVQVVGKIQVYQKRGTYSINISRMSLCGLGLLYQQYLELKNRLDKEGLFREEHKKPIPEYPETVGIITAATGEAINDIVSTFNRRFPLAKLILYPALVQGDDAPKDLIRALNLAYKNTEIDVLIIGRGGGSFEDLNCFNDEALARKLYDAPFPTISAVGHEGDYTICDFVCSFRAPTPTGAAMRLTKVKEDVIELIVSYSKRLRLGMIKSLTDNFNLYKGYCDRLNLLTPESLASKLDEKIDNFSMRLDNALNKCLDNNEFVLNNYQNRLRSEIITDQISYKESLVNQLSEKSYILLNKKIDMLESSFYHLVDKTKILNPLNIIKKGYTIVYKDNKIIYDVNELEINDPIQIRFNDGTAEASITKIDMEE